MAIKSNERYLAANILSREGIKGLSLIEQIDGKVVVTPFEHETSSTVFVSSPVAILRHGVIDEFLLDDIEGITGSSRAFDAIIKLDNLFRTSELYFDGNDIPEIVSLGHPCRVLFPAKGFSL